MKAYWGSVGITPRILDLDTRWKCMVSFTRRPLYPHGKKPWYPLDRRLGGSQWRSGRGGKEKMTFKSLFNAVSVQVISCVNNKFVSVLHEHYSH